MNIIMDAEDNITPRSWEIIKIEDTYHVVGHWGVRERRRSTHITSVEYQDDKAIVGTNSGSTYVLRKDSEMLNSTEVHFKDIPLAITKAYVLTVEEAEELAAIKERQGEALLEAHKLGIFF